MVLASLNDNELRQLALRWFQGLNEHRPLAEMLSMLAADGLEMEFPGVSVRNYADFEKWYRDVTNTYFDQDHILGDFNVAIEGARARVGLTVIWKARTWAPPAPTSNEIVMDARQTWVLQRSSDTGNPVIVEYRVDEIAPKKEVKDR